MFVTIITFRCITKDKRNIFMDHYVMTMTHSNQVILVPENLFSDIDPNISFAEVEIKRDARRDCEGDLATQWKLQL